MTLPFLCYGSRRRVHNDNRFHSPLPVPARTALIACGLKGAQNMREFAAGEISLLRAWSPSVIALPLELALSLADQKRRGLFSLPSLNTAMVVLTSVDDSPLGDHHRDLLWSAFGVPIFEQLRNTDGLVVARECEIHDGLHIVHASHRLNGEIVTDHCACGLETPRLRPSPTNQAVHA